MADTGGNFADEVVIYHSAEDECWIAHSLRTDQIGAGDRIVDALAALIRGVRELCKMAREDETIALERPAPEEIRRLFTGADTLPIEMFEVAHKMATGQWPEELSVELIPRNPDRALKAEVRETVCA